jgi:hypothetical protein
VLALALFAVGMVEYGLATLWTRVVVSRQAGATALVTFLNVLMWGFVITSLEPGNPGLLVIHGAGCALGAAIACRFGGNGAELPVETPRRSFRRVSARRAHARARRRPLSRSGPDDRDRPRTRARTGSPARRTRPRAGSPRTLSRD